MSVRWLQVAGALMVLTGCPKDPDEVNPRRDAVGMDGDAVDSGDAMVSPDRVEAGDGGDADVIVTPDASITFTFVSGTVAGVLHAAQAAAAGDAGGSEALDEGDDGDVTTAGPIALAVDVSDADAAAEPAAAHAVAPDNPGS